MADCSISVSVCENSSISVSVSVCGDYCILSANKTEQVEKCEELCKLIKRYREWKQEK